MKCFVTSAEMWTFEMLPLKTFKNNSSTWKTRVNLKLQLQNPKFHIMSNILWDFWQFLFNYPVFYMVLIPPGHKSGNSKTGFATFDSISPHRPRRATARRCFFESRTEPEGRGGRRSRAWRWRRLQPKRCSIRVGFNQNGWFIKMENPIL